MAEARLSARKRTEKGKRAAAGLRRQGMVPAVVYGPGKPNFAVTLDAREVERVLSSGHGSKVIDLALEEDGKVQETPVLIKDLLRDPIRGSVRHLDLYAVAMDHPVTTEVPIVVRGEEKRRDLGGIVQHVLHHLQISALPADLPEFVEAEVSTLPVGHSLHVQDLTLPKGVKALTPPEDVVVSIVLPTRERVEEGEAEAEGAEGAEAEAAKGKEEAKEEK